MRPTDVVGPPTDVVGPPTDVVGPPTDVVGPPTDVVGPPEAALRLGFAHFFPEKLIESNVIIA
jgi:hypothetical protein